MEKKQKSTLENELKQLILAALQKKNAAAAAQCEKLVRKSAKAISKKFEKKQKALVETAKTTISEKVKKVTAKKPEAPKKAQAVKAKRKK